MIHVIKRNLPDRLLWRNNTPMKILIVYGSQKGHTQKIAEFLRTESVIVGHQAVSIEASPEAKSPENFDAVIVASSVHAGQYNPEIIDYATKYSVLLNIVPSAFLSVGLTITRNEPKAMKELESVTKFLMDLTKWKPVMIEQIAGALEYSKYGFIKKMLIKSIMKKTGGETDTTRDYVYTDWEGLKEILHEFIHRCEPVTT